MGPAASSSTSAPDLIVTVEGQRTLFHGEDGDVVVGRETPGADLQLDHPAVSRVHVRLAPGPRWQIFDYESRNGIYVHGTRVYEGLLTDGMTVELGAPKGLTLTFRYAVDDRDKMGRLGRAVSRRCADLGLTRRDLRLRAHINRSTADNVLSGRCWPDPAACEAIDQVLSWPAGSLLAIAEGASPADITDVITPALRHNLLIDSAALRLGPIAAALAGLPATTDPDYPAHAAALWRRIEKLDTTLSSEVLGTRSEHSETLRCLAAIYRRQLSAADAQSRRTERANTGFAVTGAPIRRPLRHET